MIYDKPFLWWIPGWNGGRPSHIWSSFHLLKGILAEISKLKGPSMPDNLNDPWSQLLLFSRVLIPFKKTDQRPHGTIQALGDLRCTSLAVVSGSLSLLYPQGRNAQAQFFIL